MFLYILLFSLGNLRNWFFAFWFYWRYWGSVWFDLNFSTHKCFWRRILVLQIFIWLPAEIYYLFFVNFVIIIYVAAISWVGNDSRSWNERGYCSQYLYYFAYSTYWGSSHSRNSSCLQDTIILCVSWFEKINKFPLFQSFKLKELDILIFYEKQVVVVKFSLQKLSQHFYVFFSHPFKTVLLLSVTMAKVTNRLIVAALTKSELHLWDSTMCPVLTMFLNQYWGVWIPENTLLLVCLVWAIFNLVNFLCDTYKQIATHLNIKILTIWTDLSYILSTFS